MSRLGDCGPQVLTQTAPEEEAGEPAEIRITVEGWPGPKTKVGAEPVPQQEGARRFLAHRGGMQTALITEASRALGRALSTLPRSGRPRYLCWPATGPRTFAQLSRPTSAPWPLSAYRTEYADTPGSAEIPSAGPPLTKRLLYRLRARGVQVAALLYHTGVSSAGPGEPPYGEWWAVPASTTEVVHAARAEGRQARWALQWWAPWSPPEPPVAAVRAGPTLSSCQSAESRWWTGYSPAGTSRRRHTC